MRGTEESHAQELDLRAIRQNRKDAMANATSYMRVITISKLRIRTSQLSWSVGTVAFMLDKILYYVS